MTEHVITSGGSKITGSCSGELWMYNKEGAAQRLEKHSLSISQLTALKEGGFASASFDKTIKIFDLEAKVMRVLKGHRAPIRTLIQLDDGSLASSSMDKTIIRWDPNSGECLGTLNDAAATDKTCLLELAGGILLSNKKSELNFWNIVSNELIKTIRIPISEIGRAHV